MKKEASLSIVEDVVNHRFLMVRNHRGINNGCINFPGGKRKPGETMLACVVRETLEETGLEITNPQQVGYVEFPSKDFYVYIYKSTEYSGNLHGKKDEVDVFWQEADKIPYDKMRAADRDFLPEVLAGKFVKKRYIYDDDFQLKEIINLD